MIALIPISRFRVRYEVAAGRPFSKFEVLVLRNIRDGASSLGSLQETFQIHPRLLIEALVTLTQAGWLAVSGEEGGGFVLTGEGQAASSEVGPSSTLVSPRETYVVMERITGAVVPSGDVTFVTRRQLGELFDVSIQLRERIPYNQLDEGQVQHLLPRRPGERIRWVGPIDLDTKGGTWVAVNVDLESRSVVHLPDVWQSRLKPLVVNEARERARELEAESRGDYWSPPRSRRDVRRDKSDPDAPQLPPSEWPESLDGSDFLSTPEAHNQYLVEILHSTLPTASVLVASESVSSQRLEVVEDAIVGAVGRGVKIDLLWGTDPEGSGLDALRRLSYVLRRDGAPGLLRFNGQPSSSGINLVLRFQPDRSAEACIGSFAWMGAAEGEQATHHLSVRLRSSGAVAALVRAAAAIWASIESEVLSSTPDRWRIHATDLEELAESIGGQIPSNCTLNVIPNGGDHEAAFRNAVETAQSRFLAVSRFVGPLTETRLDLALPSRSINREFILICAEVSLSEAKAASLATRVSALGGSLMERQDNYARALVADDAALISSFDFLSDEIGEIGSRKRAVGVRITGAEPVDTIVKLLIA